MSKRTCLAVVFAAAFLAFNGPVDAGDATAFLDAAESPSATDLAGKTQSARSMKPGGSSSGAAWGIIAPAQAQSCPAPDSGDGYCGYYGGWCRYCDSDYPHYCPSTDACYQYFTEAQSACGDNYVICGRPVQ